MVEQYAYHFRHELRAKQVKGYFVLCFDLSIHLQCNFLLIREAKRYSYTVNY